MLLVIAGVGFMAYPWVSSWYNKRQALELVQLYERDVQALTSDLAAAELERAQHYNGTISGAIHADPFVGGSGAQYPGDYLSVLDISGNGMMGYLEIPLFRSKLPIFHGAAEDVLQRGIGHIPSTALPVGGVGTRCVLVGHRGLPGNELLTNADKLIIGDLFYLRVLGETFAYRIVEIQVVTPDALVDIAPVAGRDLCTLVTCTPLNINSHRLVLTGERTEYVPDAPVTGPHSLSAYERQMLIVAIAGAVGLVLVVGIGLYLRRRRRRR
ncbi:MAG: class C sortase [Actinomycetes bacterium]|nr:class C sortase [Actinomycetes bacterium]